MEIKFRPHHFLCALCFQGKGYSSSFVANFHGIMATLTSASGDDTPIQVVDHTDAICAPCPHRIDKICQTEEKIAILDQAHASALALKTNEMITWGEAKKRMAHNLTLEKFQHICATCSWKSLGICENVLREFLDKN